MGGNENSTFPIFRSQMLLEVREWERGDGNNQWELKGNWDETWLNLGSEMGMAMNHREWD